MARTELSGDSTEVLFLAKCARRLSVSLTGWRDKTQMIQSLSTATRCQLGKQPVIVRAEAGCFYLGVKRGHERGPSRQGAMKDEGAKS